ncbi:MAG: hypothetical protein DRP88_00365 [Candidatus Neomarinimicrobiota bacterium]|nr:MAG: hypothetical protein DRP88_00365 [Candidatus Neomarinimicrobiota bacterium]
MKRKNVFFIALVSILIILSYCVPPSEEPSGEMAAKSAQEKAREDSIRDMKCKLYLSFAYSYYQNQDWQGAIKNYRRMMDLGCEEKYAADIFPYLGRSYQMLAQEDPTYLDSALDVYLKGEEYLPKNIFIHKNLAYIYHLKGNRDLEIREYEKMVEIEPENIELLRTLVKLYFAAERYRDVVWAAEQILKIEPGDEQALNDRLVAYQKLGKDVLEVQKEQWEKDKGNVAKGIEYAKALADRLEYEEALKVLQQVTQANLKNREAWENLAKLYFSLGRYEEAAKTYEYISRNISPRDISIINEIVKSYTQASEFQKAYTWAKKAKQISGSSGLVFRMFGDLYYSVASCYSSPEKLTFEDKLVYKLAYDYYKKAYEKGEYDVKKKLDYLKQYLIPTHEDWFLNKYDNKGNLRKSFRPKGEYYNWIEEEPSREQ